MKKNYYIFNPGRLKRMENSLQFIKTGDEKLYLPVEDIDTIFAFGELDFNTKVMNFFAKKGIIVHFFNYYGYYTGSFYPKESLVSGMLVVKQAKHYISKRRRLFIAVKVLEAAAHNILHNLKYYHSRGKELTDPIRKIEELSEKLSNQATIPALMGIEGNIREVYYEAFNVIIDQDIQFEKRVRHPPDNMINTMISFVNSMIYTTVLSEIYKTQLSPLISFLHEPGDRRFSLSLDIAEIFKPMLGDRMIFSLLNKNQVTEESFEKGLNYLYLKDSARKIIVKEFDERLKETVRHKTLNRNVSYRQLIRLELYKLIKHLIGEKEYDGFKIWW
jgi:CRISPR-associated protein Cas1